MPANMTLADFVQTAPTFLTKGVVQQLRWVSKLLDQLSFVTTGALSARNLIDDMEEPDIAWRDLNEDYGSSRHNKPQEVQARLFDFGKDTDIEYLLLEDKTVKIYEPKVREIQKSVNTMARAFGNTLINNSTNPKAPWGIKHMIDTVPELAAQKGIAASGGLDLSASGASYAQSNRLFWRKLEEAKSLVDGGATHCLCNNVFLRIIKALARESGFLSVTQDSLNRPIYDFDGMKFIDVGRKSPKTGSQIITDTEKADGTDGVAGTDSCTSIYLMRMDRDHFQPLQMFPLRTTDFGLIPGQTYHRVRVAWPVGWMITDPMSIYRLHGLKMQ